MFLIDTNVICEQRKRKCNQGVSDFFSDAPEVYLSVITTGELKMGIEYLRYHNDKIQADHLEVWLFQVLGLYRNNILPITDEITHLWGKLRVPNKENSLDKLIAATAIVNDLTVVTRDKHFKKTGVKLLNPFI